MPRLLQSYFFLSVFVTLKPLTQFYHKFRATVLQKKKKKLIKYVSLDSNFCLNLVLKEFQVWSQTFLKKDRVLSSQNITVFSFWQSCLHKDVLRLSIFYHFFVTSEVECGISNKNGIYDLSFELPEDLRKF